MSLLERFIEDTNRASSQEEVFGLFRTALGGFGFNSVVYSLLTDHPSINRPKSHGIQGNYPQDWMHHYISNGYFDTDPVPKHVFNIFRPFSWNEVVETLPLNRTQIRIMDQAKEARLLDGVAVPLHGPRNEVAGVGLACLSGGASPNPTMLGVIGALSYQFHIAFSAFDIIKPSGDDVGLTLRESEVLHWAAEGKSNSVIGDIIGISDNCVKFHFRNIFRKLDAVNRQTAVVKAIRLGLINPSFIRSSS
jgi:DNA-binding CsgD family transcriptional regulator